MKKAGNLALALSVEGTRETTDMRRGDGVYEKVVEAMRLLKKHKCLFGTSVCYTSANYKAVTSDEFYNMEIENGAKFAWYFHYMPIGSDADTSLLLTPNNANMFTGQSEISATKATASRFSRLIFKMTANLSADV